MRRFSVLSLVAFAASVTAAAAAPVTFTNDGNTLQSFIVPTTGTYNILVFGAEGTTLNIPNTSFFTPGGLGAEIGGDFFLTAGEALTIAVGNSPRGFSFGSGGGGSFVVGPGSTPLVIAGGGGGGGFNVAGQPGLAGTAGGNGVETMGNMYVAGLGGVNGGGGGGGGTNSSADGIGPGGGGGGGGFLSAGQGQIQLGAPTPFGGGGGYPNLLGGNYQGGAGAPNGGGTGGFGGGGTGESGGGGGGGYSGGGGGGFGGGGGGGSFDGGTNQVLMPGFNSGDGRVVITELTAVAVPEPASLALLGVGLIGLLTVPRRRAG